MVTNTPFHAISGKLVLISLVFFLLIPSSAHAALTCTVRTDDCAGDVEIFKMSSTSNAHAELITGSNYNNYVCCSGVDGLNNACNGNYDVVLRLSGVTNAHAEKNTESNYVNDVCIAAATSADCRYENGGCTGGYICLASISGDTNAHVGDCNAYNTKICCDATGPTNPPTTAITNPPASSFHSGDFLVSVTDTDANTCEYMVKSNGVETVAWTSRTCNADISLTVGEGNNCRDQGINMCNISTRVSNGVDTDADSRVFSVDWQGPNCTVTSLGPWGGDPLFLNWTGTDNFGITSYIVQVHDGSSWLDFLDPSITCDYEGNTPPEGGVCSLTEGNVYKFRCSASDIAGNSSGWSAEETTAIDGMPPVVTFQEGQNFGEWVSNTSKFWAGDSSNNAFILNWSSFEETSGLYCYNMRRNNGGSWDPFIFDSDGNETDCILIENLTFGPQYPLQPQEGVTYEFRVRANDSAGNTGSWVYGNTTIDHTQPDINLEVNFIGNGLNIVSTATDSISGVQVHGISWNSYGDSGSTSCSPGDPFGGESLCTHFIADATSVAVTANATDRAGHNISTTMFFGRIVNFKTHSLNIVLGDNYLLRVDVLNPETVTENITLDIFGTYPPDLLRFADIGSGNYSITNGGKTLTVYNVKPNDRRVFFIDMVSPYVYSGLKTVEVDAMLENSGTQDSDIAYVHVTYPASFSGLTDLACLILIFLSCLLFYLKNYS